MSDGLSGSVRPVAQALASVRRLPRRMASGQGWSAGALRRGMNIWPPLRCAGITVRGIDPDWGWATVELKAHWWNRNYVGVHFGGSLFAMTDPFWMLLMMNRIGPGYIVWDKAAQIDFVAPGRGDVPARFVLPEERVAAVRQAVDATGRHVEWFEVEVVDAAGLVVARVRKQLYARPKERATDSAATP